MTKALIPLADGVEEMEAVILIDVLRRAGWHVVCVSLKPNELAVTASRGVRIVADAVWTDIVTMDFDVLVLPGGAGGTKYLLNDERVVQSVREFESSGRIVAAICAAPLVLQKAGILKNRTATCHPAVMQELESKLTVDSPVVIDNRVITSRSAGTAFAMALSLIEYVDGSQTSQKVAAGLAL